jgi:hypothetical protein
MVRLVHERQLALEQVDDFDLERPVRARLRLEPASNRQATRPGRVLAMMI